VRHPPTVETSASVMIQGVTVAETTTTSTITELAPMLPIGTLARTAANGLNYFNAPKWAWDIAATGGSAIACYVQGH